MLKIYTFGYHKKESKDSKNSACPISNSQDLCNNSHKLIDQRFHHFLACDSASLSLTLLACKVGIVVF